MSNTVIFYDDQFRIFHFEIKRTVVPLWLAFLYLSFSYLPTSHQGVLWLRCADSWRQSTPHTPHNPTRGRFRALPSKTTAYQDSVLPALSRLLVDHNTDFGYYPQALSEFEPYFPFRFCTDCLFLLAKVCLVWLTSLFFVIFRWMISSILYRSVSACSVKILYTFYYYRDNVSAPSRADSNPCTTLC